MFWHEIRASWDKGYRIGDEDLFDVFTEKTVEIIAKRTDGKLGFLFFDIDGLPTFSKTDDLLQYLLAGCSRHFISNMKCALANSGDNTIGSHML